MMKTINLNCLFSYLQPADEEEEEEKEAEPTAKDEL